MKPVNWRRVLKLAAVSSVVAYIGAYIATALFYAYLMNNFLPKGAEVPASSNSGPIQAILAPMAAIVAFASVVFMALNAALDD